jgi:uncharacterized membrane protein YqjE
LATLVSAVETRVGIFASELQEERIRLTRMLLLGAVTLFCLGLGITLLSLFIVVLYWDSDRLAVLGILCGLFLGTGFIGAIVLAFLARGQRRPLQATTDTLAKDKKALEL